jgi:hypothetical protein
LGCTARRKTKPHIAQVGEDSMIPFTNILVWVSNLAFLLFMKVMVSSEISFDKEMREKYPDDWMATPTWLLLFDKILTSLIWLVAAFDILIVWAYFIQ